MSQKLFGTQRPKSLIEAYTGVTNIVRVTVRFIIESDRFSLIRDIQFLKKYSLAMNFVLESNKSRFAFTSRLIGAAVFETCITTSSTNLGGVSN